MNRYLPFVVLLLLLSSTAFGQDPSTFRAMFYNVENLFDTLDQANTQDEEYTPNSKKKWGAKRYQEKLDHLAAVITSYNPEDLPEIIGLCEVENRSVVQDLIDNTNLKDGNFQVVHDDSPDNRGIDVALMYDADRFTYESHQSYRVPLEGERPNTRDILHVTGKVGEETLHLLVNHWPSRSGGQERSEPRRILVASKVREAVDEILAAEPDAKIIVMGDLNDHPIDKSVFETLRAKNNKKPSQEGDLFNLMYDYHLAGEGSHAYKGNWGVLDHMIVSYGLLNAKSGLTIGTGDGYIHKQDFFLYTNKAGEKFPSRSYGGPKYFGGYSDHLPVIAELKIKK